jgi:hypothetical protein
MATDHGGGKRLPTAKPSAGLHANGFALLPIEAGAIREACPFHVSADARKEEDAQPDGGMVSRAWQRSSGIGHFCARCGFFNSIIPMRFGLSDADFKRVIALQHFEQLHRADPVFLFA